MSSLSPTIPRQIFGIVLIFLLLGEIMIYSATGVLGLQRHGTEFYFVFRQSVCALVGIAAMLLVSRIRYQLWDKTASILFIAQLVLSGLTLLTNYGHNALGATRWLKIGPLALQPSELSKFTAAIFLSSFLARRTSASIRQWVLHLAGFFTLLVLIFRQPDLGSTVCLTAMAVGLFFVSGVNPIYLFGAGSVSGVFFLFSIFHSEYRRRRVLAYLNPWLDPTGNGFQTIQSFLSFYSGKIFGLGIGNGNSKLFFLPEVHTDFIFSLVGEELGFLGTGLVLLLFVYFGYLLFKVASRAPDKFGVYLGFSIGFSLLLQVVINLAAVTGLIPIKGLPLPFISWGRSALLANLFSVGILLNIARQSGLLPANTVAPSAGDL
jgi:cell division protein FtsW